MIYTYIEYVYIDTHIILGYIRTYNCNEYNIHIQIV